MLAVESLALSNVEVSSERAETLAQSLRPEIITARRRGSPASPGTAFP